MHQLLLFMAVVTMLVYVTSLPSFLLKRRVPEHMSSVNLGCKREGKIAVSVSELASTRR